ncbi:uncharacterized protein LOC114732503 [Neltuma alba]|uniref:uncharacterized protein LOC114732503 n=1 Tax=Neltuma alba TaxID=207710 RepID=UPI0010A464C8|nr:uncharacterized protein LOC114732503 [Prosopis alba]
MTATFQSRDDYFFALEGGPWLIQNHYLTVQTWKRNFNPWNEKIQKLAIWVRLPGLPGDYYDRKFFYNLGNKIGTAIKVDEMTLTRARTMYARLCVEIDLNAPLLPSYFVDGNWLKIEYEGLHMICFQCGKFGHSSERCPSKITAQNPDAGWKVDSRRGRKHLHKESRSAEGQKREVRHYREVRNASRFAILEDEGDKLEKRGEEEESSRTLVDITNEPHLRETSKKEERVQLRKKATDGRKELEDKEGKGKGRNKGSGKKEAKEETSTEKHPESKKEWAQEEKNGKRRRNRKGEK